MSVESTIHKELGAVQESLKHISGQLEKAEAGRKHTYERLEGMDRKLDHLDWRVIAIENKLTNITPTIDKVERVHMQVEGASKFGTFISRTGFFLFSAATGIIGYLANYITWK